MSTANPYAPLVTRLFREVPGAGRPDGPGWVSGEAAEPLSGSKARWHLRAEAGRITAARYEIRGCPHSVAAAALVAAAIAGRPVAGLELDLPGIAARLDAPASKMGRFFVIQDALRKALLLLEPRSA